MRIDTLTDPLREKYKKEMEEWKYLYPFTAAVLFGDRKLKENDVKKLIIIGEKRRLTT